MGPATRRKFVRAGSLGQAEPEPSLPRAKRAVSGAGGGQHGVWAQDWGGRCGDGSPAPSPPPPGRVRSTKPSAQARPAPRPEESGALSGWGRGWEPNFFLPRDRHVSFLSSRAPAPPGLQARGGTEAPSLTRGGGLRGAGAPSAGRFPAAPGAMCSDSGLGRGGGCALCVNCWECSVSARPGGVSGRAGEVVRKLAREWLQVSVVACVGGCPGRYVERVLPQAS